MKLINGFIPLIIVALFLLFLLLGSESWLMARKVIAHLMLPAGFLWLIGMVMIAWPGITAKVRITVGLLWIVYSLAGSPYAGVMLLSGLERPQLKYQVLEGKLDALVLLGGGTTLSPNGSAALGVNGDRVLQPALLYKEGMVGKLIATGRGVTEVGQDRLCGREASEIWQRLGIPKEAIIELNEPRNTSEELVAIAALSSEKPEWQRVGLATSAYHMRRALTHARDQGLEMIPVPSGFRSLAIPFSTHYLIPQGRGFRDVQTALWEYLGALL